MSFLNSTFTPYILLAVLAVLLALVFYAFSKLRHAQRLATQARTSEQNLRLLIERLQDGAVIVREGKIALVNPKIVQWTGYATQFFVAKPVTDLFVETDRAKIAHFFQQNNFDPAALNIPEVHLFNCVGDHRLVQLQVIRSQWRDLPALVVILKDLTPIHQANQLLTRMEDRSRLWFQISPVGLAFYDTDLITVEVNQRMAEILHTQKESLVGLDLKTLDNRRMVEIFQASVEGCESNYQGPYASTITNFQGEILLRTIPLREEDQIVGGIAMVEDLTRWVEAQRALLASEDLFTRTFQILPDSATLSRLKDGLFLQVNPGFCQLTGYTPTEVVGKTSLEVNFWADPQDRRIIREQLAEKGEIHNTEVLLRRKDGSTFDATFSARLVGDTPEPTLIAYIRDISEQKKHLALIQRQLEQLAALRKIDQAITGSVNLPFVLRVLLDQIISQLNLDAAAVMVYDPDMDRCEYLAQQGFQNSPPRLYNPHLPDGYAAQAFYQRKMVIVPNLSENPDPFWSDPHFRNENFVFYTAVPLKSKGEIYGILEVFTRQAQHPGEDWFEFLQAVVGQAAIAVENALLFSRLQKQIIDVNAAFDATLDGFARAIDLFLGEPEGYTRAIVYFCQDLAMSIDLDNKALSSLSRGIYLNNLAMICVPTPNQEQLAHMSIQDWEAFWARRKYVLELLAGVDYLKPALEIPYSSLECWDGSGHPRGLSGNIIPLAARLYAVVQAWVHIQVEQTSPAPADPIKAADEHLRALAGKRLDPEMVNAFLSLPTREPFHFPSQPGFSSQSSG